MSTIIWVHEIPSPRKFIRPGMMRNHTNPGMCSHQGTPRRISRNVAGIFPINGLRTPLNEHVSFPIPEGYKTNRLVECFACETILEVERKDI